jgi:hypothetical protein
MPPNDHFQAWDSYRSALTELYQRDLETLIATPEATDVEAADEPALNRALESSERLEGVLTEKLESDDASERQLAQMKLAAAASVDAGIAADLVRQAEDAPAVEALIARAEGELSSLSFVISEADPVLSAATLDQVPGLEGGGPNGNAQAETVEKAIAKTISGIRDDAAAGGNVAVGGLVAIGVPVSDALGAVSQELIGNLGKIGPLIHKALEFLKKAIDKLLGLLGGKVAKAISDKLSSWLEDLKDGKMTAGILDRVWQTDGIEEEAKKAVREAGPDLTEERAAGAIEELEGLGKAFAKQAGFVSKVLKVVKFVSPAIAALHPGGPIFLAAGYGAALLYLTLGGADYVDWQRAELDGFFDRVNGVRHIVDAAVVSAARS